MDFSVNSDTEYTIYVSDNSGESSSQVVNNFDAIRTTVVKTYGKKDRVVFCDKMQEAGSLQNRRVFNNSNEEAVGDYMIDPFDKLFKNPSKPKRPAKSGVKFSIPKTRDSSKKMKLSLFSQENQTTRRTSNRLKKKNDNKKLMEKENKVKEPVIDPRFHQNWSDIENTVLVVESKKRKEKSSSSSSSKSKQSLNVDDEDNNSTLTSEVPEQFNRVKQKVSISKDFLELESYNASSKTIQATSTPIAQHENKSKPPPLRISSIISPFPRYKETQNTETMNSTLRFNTNENRLRDCAVMLTRLNQSLINSLTEASPSKEKQKSKDRFENLCQTFEKMSTGNAKAQKTSCCSLLIESELSDVPEESEENNSREKKTKEKEKPLVVEKSTRLSSQQQQQCKRSMTPEPLIFSTQGKTKLPRLAVPMDRERRLARNDDRRRTTLLAALTPHDISINGKSIYGVNNVLMHCGQNTAIPFTDFLRNYSKIQKIDEGSYGEVFKATNKTNEEIVLKIQPIFDEDDNIFDTKWPEVVCSCRLSELTDDENNSTENFIQINKVACLQGKFPKTLLKLWDEYAEKIGTESDRPDFNAQQMYLGYEAENGGTNLESYQFSNMAQAVSVFLQIATALAVAEKVLQFEHRDLHWGNILVKVIKEPLVEFTINGIPRNIQSQKVKATIIDFGLSRLKEDCAVFVELDKQDIMSGTGDYQFDVYRKMREVTGNKWEGFYPKTNILWLHYLVDKLLTQKQYSSSSRAHLLAKQQLNEWNDSLLKYSSAYSFVVSNLDLFTF